MVPEESTSSVKDSDDLLRLIGNPGRFQIIQYLVFCCQFLSYMSEFSIVFFIAPPTGIFVDRHDVHSGPTLNFTADNQSDIMDHREYGNVSYGLIPFRYVRSEQACKKIGLDLHNTSTPIIYIFPDSRQQSIISDVRYDSVLPLLAKSGKQTFGHHSSRWT